LARFHSQTTMRTKRKASLLSDEEEEVIKVLLQPQPPMPDGMTEEILQHMTLLAIPLKIQSYACSGRRSLPLDMVMGCPAIAEEFSRTRNFFVQEQVDGQWVRVSGPAVHRFFFFLLPGASLHVVGVTIAMHNGHPVVGRLGSSREDGIITDVSEEQRMQRAKDILEVTQSLRIRRGVSAPYNPVQQAVALPLFPVRDPSQFHVRAIWAFAAFHLMRHMEYDNIRPCQMHDHFENLVEMELTDLALQ